MATRSPIAPDLHYPFGFEWAPEQGKPYEVAPGVFWLRMPLPISLDHINLWLLKDGDGWTIVDTGFDHHTCKSVWDTVFSEFIELSQVKRILVTHYHPDHIGLAAWLAHKCDAKVLMSRGEYRYYRGILKRDNDALKDQVLEYVTELNFPSQYHERMIEFFKVDEKPEETRVRKQIVEFMQEGDVFRVGENDWTVVCGNGHSPEHCCLYNPSLNLLISGDQAIPRISSNVSVYLANRDEDPLGDWISSCEKLRDKIPPETLILPSHQEPFVGIAPRMQYLIDSHHARLDRLRTALQTQALTVDLLRATLFTRKLNPLETVLATGETQAHLNYLLHRHEIKKTVSANGVANYESVAKAA